ncbi:MAG: SDR family oxidoreductase [Acidobacteria bacterium]|nr:SDR family oxidoreductase [Acidobacteriota bacterium]
MLLKDRVAFVTGAGSGIGKAAALLLAREGARVGALDADGEDLEKTVAEIEGAGGSALALVADVSDAAQVRAAVERVAVEWGRVDVVFANAGVNGVWAPLEALEPDEWDKTLDINLKGTYLTVKYAAPYLKRRGGSVVITSSVNGTRMFSNTGATAYACSKAGQVAFARMVALELAPDRVRVNVVCPGAIETNIEENTEKRELEKVKAPVEFPEGKVPLTHGKPGSAEQVAQLVLFLASDASSHISGTEVFIDGAQSLLQG